MTNVIATPPEDQGHGILVRGVSLGEYPMQYSIEIPGRPYLGALTAEQLDEVARQIIVIRERQMTRERKCDKCEAYWTDTHNALIHQVDCIYHDNCPACKVGSLE